MGRCNVGVTAAHPFSWLLSSPQQPLETEDPPTVSLAPQYTSQRLCRAIEFFGGIERCENSKIFEHRAISDLLTVKVFHSAVCKFFSICRLDSLSLEVASGLGSTDLLADRGGNVFGITGNLALVFTFNHYASQRFSS